MGPAGIHREIIRVGAIMNMEPIRVGLKVLITLFEHVTSENSDPENGTDNVSATKNRRDVKLYHKAL